MLCSRIQNYQINIINIIWANFFNFDNRSPGVYEEPLMCAIKVVIFKSKFYFIGLRTKIVLTKKQCSHTKILYYIKIKFIIVWTTMIAA